MEKPAKYIQLDPKTEKFLSEKSRKPFSLCDLKACIEKYFDHPDSSSKSSDYINLLLSYIMVPMGSIFQESSSSSQSFVQEEVEKCLLASNENVKRLIPQLIHRFEEKLRRIREMNLLSLELFGYLASLVRGGDSEVPNEEHEPYNNVEECDNVNASPLFLDRKEPYKCGICFKVLNTRSSKWAHLKTHGKTVICHICGKELKFHSVKQHMLIVHEGGGNAKCDICEKTLRRANLKHHIATVHRNERNFSCETCGMLFKQVSSLRDHIRIIHEKAEAAKCQFCEKVLGSLETMTRHVMYVHEGRKEERCEQCGKRFSRKNNLRTHIKLVHDKIKDFQCDICNGRFSTLQAVQIHKKNVHKY